MLAVTRWPAAGLVRGEKEARVAELTTWDGFFQAAGRNVRARRPV